MPSSYKLVYTNHKGRAEQCRWIFAAAGAEYEDKRLTSEEWKELKPNTPSGQMPMLEVDGVMMFQSQAMARFLANQFGLAGKTPMDHFKADVVVDTVVDAMNAMIALYVAREDKEKSAELKKKFIEEQFPAQLKTLEKLACDDGHFVEGQFTWADINFTQFLEFLELFEIPVVLDAYPKVNKITEKTKAHPKIAEWLEKRPKTDM